MPGFNTVPRPMGRLVRDNYILYPEDAMYYIMPDNGVVRWFASNTILNDDALVWRHDNSRGDCEDFSLAFASILEAKDILAQVLGVRLVNGQYHWVIECEFAGHIRYADINRNHLIIFQDENPTIDRIWETIDGECIIRIN